MREAARGSVARVLVLLVLVFPLLLTPSPLALGRPALVVKPAGYRTGAVAPAVAFPLKASADGRYLVDQNNDPFLIAGDSPQAAPFNISTADVATFMADRAASGFNTVWMIATGNTYDGGRSDWSSYDGILPFTNTIGGNPDLSTPNPAYWARVDGAIQAAAARNMAILLAPIDCAGGGGMPVLRANGLSNAFNYGVFLGTRYGGYPNITWLSGIDFQSWTTPGDDQLCQAVARGIASVAPQQLQTVELNYPVSASRDDPTWSPPVNLDWVYAQYPQYGEMLREYNRTPSIPYFMGEANYEGENNLGRDPSTPLVLRKQEYWTALSGGAGQLFGNHYTWQFLPGWQNDMDTVGSTQFIYMTRLLLGRDWWRLVPDQSHQVVTTGYGTYDPNDTITHNDYVTTAAAPDGTLALSYLPSIRTITVNMSSMSGPVTAQWYDPTSGIYVPIEGSPFTPVGLQQFTPPGTNSGGDGDWVLVLTVSASSVATSTVTATPLSLTATSTPVVVTSTATTTPLPPSASATDTPIPPSATPTATREPPTATATSTSGTATIALGARIRSPFERLTISGTAFGPHERVWLYWDKVTASPLVTVTAQATGAFAASSTVPQTAMGKYTVIAIGLSTGRSAHTSIFVRPAIFLSASHGKAGTRADLIGVGFSAHEVVAGLWYPGYSILNGAASNASGTVAFTFTAPLRSARTYYVLGYGLRSKAHALAPFTVAANTSPFYSGARRGRATRINLPVRQQIQAAIARLHLRLPSKPSPTVTCTRKRARRAIVWSCKVKKRGS